MEGQPLHCRAGKSTYPPAPHQYHLYLFTTKSVLTLVIYWNFIKVFQTERYFKVQDYEERGLNERNSFGYPKGKAAPHSFFPISFPFCCWRWKLKWILIFRQSYFGNLLSLCNYLGSFPQVFQLFWYYQLS